VGVRCATPLTERQRTLAAERDQAALAIGHGTSIDHDQDAALRGDEGRPQQRTAPHAGLAGRLGRLFRELLERAPDGR
jgi:hypothetical protein